MTILIAALIQSSLGESKLFVLLILMLLDSLSCMDFSCLPNYVDFAPGTKSFISF